MENAMVLLYDLCRLCLDESGVDNIFNPVDYTQDILTFTGIQINSSDKLPITICNSCREIITCAKALRDVARANDKHLHRLLGDNNDDNQVLITDSHSHLVIITSCTEQNENEAGEHSNISNTSSHKTSYKSKIVFESDDDTIKSNSKNKKQNKKKRKSSTKSENISVSKRIAVRKDLFDSSVTVTSSTKTSKESLPLTSRETKDPNNIVVTSSTTKSVQTPTSTTSSSKTPEKMVKVGDKMMKVHKYEFECETCNKTYATHKKLYLHQLSHNKKFYCPLDACLKKFATKGDLQKHIRSHTGEKPYKCDLCELSFTQNVTLKNHKESKHIEQHS